MHLEKIFDPDLLRRHIADGNVTVGLHPDLGLRIYNYTAKCQWSRSWDDVTRQCRGLIATEDGEIIARPFPKFFSYGEVRPPNFVMTKWPVVTEKMDGSLGILWSYENHVGIATRGSFVSDQAKRASKMFYDIDAPLLDGHTYLFEILYPENRIVVDYGGLSELVLLTIIKNSTGEDLAPWEYEEWPGTKVQQHFGVKTIDEAYRIGAERTEGEGVVACWYQHGKPSFRMKVKCAAYVRLHRIVTGVSSKTVWEHLRDGKPFDELLDHVPDEWSAWLRSTIDELQVAFATMVASVNDDFTECCEGLPEQPHDRRRTFASRATKKPNSAALFRKYDGKDYEEVLWKQLQPKFSKPFRDIADES
jgi:RNA ligase